MSGHPCLEQQAFVFRRGRPFRAKLPGIFYGWSSRILAAGGDSGIDCRVRVVAAQWPVAVVLDGFDLMDRPTTIFVLPQLENR